MIIDGMNNVFILKLVRTSTLHLEVFLALSNNKISCIKSALGNII